MHRAESSPVYDSARRGSTALEELYDVFRYRNLIVQFVRRDLLTRYKRSVLGVAWTMLNPLGTMIVLTLVFSRAFGGAQQDYAAYVLSGLMAWNFFSQTTNAASLHLVWGGSLLKRIYVPRTVFALSATGTGLVNLALSLVPLLLVMLVTDVPIRWTIILLPIPILFLAMFTLGLGLWISTIAIYFADIAEMYQVALTAWLYLSPVIWTDQILPEKIRYWIVLLNPLSHLLNLFRAPIYAGRVPTGSELLISGTIALVTLVTGWLFFTRKSDEFAYRV
jgi:ABC-type polysaccharide/polyol phosphate export permease